MNTNLFRDTRGLTLLELLVTIAVLAIVAVIAIPVVTNVVSNTSDRAAEQQNTDVADFVSKYVNVGTFTYDPDNQIFTGYIDTNGDGQVDADEKIEELTITPDKFTVTRTDGGDGVAPATTATAASYGSIPDDSFTVTLANAAENTSALSAPTEQVYMATFTANAAKTQLTFTANTQTASSTESAYTGWRIEAVQVPAGTNFDGDWSSAAVYEATTWDPITITVTPQIDDRIYLRTVIESDAGYGPADVQAVKYFEADSEFPEGWDWIFLGNLCDLYCGVITFE